MISVSAFISVLGLAAFTTAGLASCNSDKGQSGGGTGPDPAASEWKVGAYLSLSGANTAFGVDTKEGIELAVDELNKAGGVKGKPMKVLYEDDKSNPNEATNKVLQLITRDKVIALLGEIASERSRNGGIVANKYKIPMITPSSTNPDVTKVGPFVFRVCFTDDVQGQVGARFIVQNLKKKKLAILFASDDLYSSGLAREFRDEAKKIGGEVAIEKGFLKSETNFTTYISEIKNANVEAIYAPVYYNAMVQIARQAKGAGVKGDMFVGSDGWDANELLADAGEDLEGAYYTNHYAPDIPWPHSQEFVKKYQDHYHREPSSMAVLGYDSAKVLADAIGRAQAGTADSIRDAIGSTKNFQGASGAITINSERNADKPIVIVRIHDKKFTFGTTVGGEQK